MPNINTGKPKVKKAGGCRCIFFGPISETEILDDQTNITFGGVTGNYEQIRDFVFSAEGTIHLHNYYDDDLDQQEGFINLQICLPNHVSEKPPSVLIINGTEIRSSWIIGPCDDDNFLQCWVKITDEIGFDNTFTSWRDTNASLLFRFVDKPDVTIELPNATGWSDQVAHMSNAFAQAVEESFSNATFCTNGCGGLPQPLVVLPDMKWRYAGSRLCPGECAPYEIIYNSDQRSDVPLDYNVIRTDPIYLDRCTDCDESSSIWRINGGPLVVEENEINPETNRPYCSFPCSAGIPELPYITPCDERGEEDGCFLTENEDGTFNVILEDVTLYWKICDSVTHFQYLINVGEDTQEEVALPEDAYFGNCEDGTPIDVFECEQPESKGHCYYRIKKAAIRPLGDAVGNGTTSTSFAGETLDGFICGTWEASTPTSGSGPAQFGGITNWFISTYNSGSNVYANTIRVNTWSKDGACALNTKLRMTDVDLPFGEGKGELYNLSGLSGYSSIDTYNPAPAGTPSAYYPFYDNYQDSNLNQSAFNVGSGQDYTPLVDSANIQVTYNGDIRNQVISACTDQSGQSVNWIFVEYLVPLREGIDCFSGEKILIDDWDFDDADPYNEDLTPKIFTTQLSYDSENVVYRPCCESSDYSPDCPCPLPNENCETDTETVIRCADGDQTITGLDSSGNEITVNITDEDEILYNIVTCNGIVQSISIVSINNSDVQLLLPSPDQNGDNNPAPFLTKECDPEPEIKGPACFTDENGVRWDCYQIVSVQNGTTLVYFTQESNEPGTPAGELEPCQEDLLNFNKGCVKIIEQSDSIPPSLYESISHGDFVMMDNGVKYFVPFDMPDERIFDYTEVCCDEYKLTSLEYFDKCIFIDGDIDNCEESNVIRIFESIRSCIDQSGKVISVEKEYLDEALNPLDMTLLSDPAIVVDCTVDDLGQILICHNSCYEYQPPIIVKSVKSVKSVSQLSLAIKENKATLIKQSLSFVRSRGLKEVTGSKRDLIASLNASADLLSDQVKEFINAFDLDDSELKDLDEKLSKISFEIDSLEHDSENIPLTLIDSRAKFIMNEISRVSDDIVFSSEAVTAEDDVPEVDYPRGTRLLITQCCACGSDTPVSETYYISQDEEYNEVDSFDLDGNWVESNCDENLNCNPDQEVSLDQCTIESIKPKDIYLGCFKQTLFRVCYNNGAVWAADDSCWGNKYRFMCGEQSGWGFLNYDHTNYKGQICDWIVDGEHVVSGNQTVNSHADWAAIWNDNDPLGNTWVVEPDTGSGVRCGDHICTETTNPLAVSYDRMIFKRNWRGYTVWSEPHVDVVEVVQFDKFCNSDDEIYWVDSAGEIYEDEPENLIYCGDSASSFTANSATSLRLPNCQTVSICPEPVLVVRDAFCAIYDGVYVILREVVDIANGDQVVDEYWIDLSTGQEVAINDPTLLEDCDGNEPTTETVVRCYRYVGDGCGDASTGAVKSCIVTHMETTVSTGFEFSEYYLDGNAIEVTNDPDFTDGSLWEEVCCKAKPDVLHPTIVDLPLQDIPCEVEANRQSEYVNDDNTTDIDFSIGGAGQMKWNIGLGQEDDADATGPFIKSCVDDGCSAVIDIVDVEGNAHQYTVTGVDTDGTDSGNWLFAGEDTGGTGTAGKVRSASISCTCSETSTQKGLFVYDPCANQSLEAISNTLLDILECPNPLAIECLKKRTFKVGYDNGVTAGSSDNNCGDRNNLIRYQWEFEVVGWEVNGSPVGAGETIGPFTGWTEQLQGWADFFNSVDPNFVEGECEAEFGRKPAPTWRYTEITCCNPTAKYGALTLRRTSDGCVFTVYPVLTSDETITATRYATLDCDGNKVINWCDSSGAPTAAPENPDCFVPCAFRFDPYVYGPIPDCEQKEYNVCDNATDPSTPFVSVVTICDGVRSVENYTLDSYTTAQSFDDFVEYEVQGDIVDCATGEPIEFPKSLDEQILEKNCEIADLLAVKKYMHVGVLYQLQNGDKEGVTLEYWQPSALGGSAVGHDNPVNIFGSNLDAHPNPPDVTITLPSTSFSTSGNATDLGFASNADTNGTDQVRMTTYVCSEGPFDLIDTNTNTGERGAVLINGSQLLEDNTDSVSADRAAFPPISMCAGVSSLVIVTSDLSAWQGVSPNSTGEAMFLTEPPIWKPIQVFKCVDLTGGYVDCDGNEITVGEKDFWDKPKDNTCSSIGVWGGC